MQFLNEIYASKVIKNEPQNFTGVQVEGVRYDGPAGEDGRRPVVKDNEQPEFTSVYVHHKDGRWLAVADFGAHAEAATYGLQLAERYREHGWTFADALAAAH